MKTVTKDFGVTISPPRAYGTSASTSRAPGRSRAWHPGAGSPSFFFADEILAE